MYSKELMQKVKDTCDYCFTESEMNTVMLVTLVANIAPETPVQDALDCVYDVIDQYYDVKHGRIAHW